MLYLIDYSRVFRECILRNANLEVTCFPEIDDIKIDSPKHRIDEENQNKQNEPSIYIAGAAVLHRSGMFPWKRKLH